MANTTDSQLTIFTVGWEPPHADYLLSPIEKQTNIRFIHGQIGDATRVEHAQKQYPALTLVALSKREHEPLPNPDLDLLASIECVGIPTFRSMIQGDRVLRYRSEEEALAYATLLAKNIKEQLQEHQPDVVLASYDSLHSAVSLAVAKSLDIPWVAMAFSVIPDNLTGFCYAMTPNSLLPLKRPVDEQLRSTAEQLMQNVRAKNQKVLAYKPPTSLAQWLEQYIQYAKNFIRRKTDSGHLGIDRFTYPTAVERAQDIIRRSFNRFRLPTADMLSSPPEGRYVYYPFHMAPESMLDTWAPFYQNQLAFVAQCALAIPADMTFVIKLHFSDPDNYSRQQLQQLINMPRLRIADPNAPGNVFIEKASLVLGIQGTSCIEAALLGKPVLIFGDSPYLHFPGSERAKRPDELYEQIRSMLDRPPSTDEDIVEAYAAHMARYMPGRINDWARPIESDELVRYVDCFKALSDYVTDPQNRTNWYNKPPFTASTDAQTSNIKVNHVRQHA